MRSEAELDSCCGCCYWSDGRRLSRPALCKRTCWLWDSLVVDCNVPNCSSAFISTQCKTHQFPTKKYSCRLYTSLCL